MSALLEIRDLHAAYGDVQALFGVDLDVEAAEVVAVIGANGSGKSTLLKCMTGMLGVSATSVRLKQRAIGGTATADIVRAGLSMVPEGRRLFASLSVEENLLMGAACGRRGPWNLQRVYRLFPILEQRRRSPALALSGGQQQMVAIGRALMSNPELLLCDELSLGLAPIVIREIYEAIPQILAEGMAMLIVEQDVAMAQRMSRRLYCLQEGRVALQGRSDQISREQISQAYFGV